MILCISVLFVVISPFSFLILLIWFLSLYFSMSLDKGLSILFILSKNQLLPLFIFAMVFFCFLAFISTQNLKISFLLLTLGFFTSSFSSCFRCRVKLFMWLFSCFLRYACIAMNLPLQFSSVQFISAAQSCPTLCNPMNHSTPGLLVHHQLPEFTETHVHRVSDAIQSFHPLSSPSPPAPNPSQH